MGTPVRYGAAVLCTAAAWGIRTVLDPLLGDVVPFSTFFVAVLVMGWWGGWRPAVLTAVLSYVVGDYYFVQPRGTLFPRTVPEATACVLFVLVSAAIVCATEQLRRAHRKLSSTLESMEEGFRTLDRHWRYTYVNAAASQTLQKTPDEMLGRGIWEIFPKPVRTRWHERARVAMERRVPVGFELHYTPLDKWFEYKCYPTPEGIAVFSKDITERKRADQALQRAQAELARANANLERLVQERTAKLEETVTELEHFSYSLTHDLRAPLRAMQSFGGILEQELCAGCHRSPNLDYLHRIRVAAGRLDNLITDSLNYSKAVREELPVVPVEVSKLLRGMIDTYPNLQPSRCEIAVEFDGLMVLGNEAALTQVFSNLLGNAVKFVAPGVKPHVRVRAESHGRTTRIWVEDNGIGIPKEGQQRIFDLFQRLHRQDEYPGTGMGLAIVRKVLQRMGGTVCLESEPGRGSRFGVELPSAPNPGKSPG